VKTIPRQLTIPRWPLPALFAAALALFGQPLFGQPLKPADLLKQPADAWPTYNGDYSGRRFSPLTQINSSNVNTLSLAWATRVTAGAGGGGGRGGAGGGGVQIKSTPLMVDGILYFTWPPTRARAVNSGTISTRPTPAAPLEIAASPCTGTGCTSNHPTATW
jgi:glucose dehydrogenase